MTKSDNLTNETPHSLLHYYVGPILLMVVCTVLGPGLAFIGAPNDIAWSLFGTKYSYTIVFSMMMWSLASLWIPGQIFEGPTTTFGYTPRYKANGLQYFFATLLVFSVIFFLRPKLAVEITANFADILVSCNILGLILCLYLLVQGKVNPQTNEKLGSYSILYEFYRGMEIHPRLLGVDVKQLIICRFGMMSWQLLVIVFFVAGCTTYGFNMASFASVVLQTVYLAKFYWWETGYFCTLDIIYDRAGYYLCWGCMVWVQSLYAFSNYYLVFREPKVGTFGGILILLAGLACIGMNYRVDWEKEYFRDKKGKCEIWGKTATFIKATYKTESGEKESLLLTSGCWGISRHLNYVFEILAAVCWCLPTIGLGILSWAYPIFLFILLTHRLYRDEDRCQKKYGKYWEAYCLLVPYRYIPGIY